MNRRYQKNSLAIPREMTELLMNNKKESLTSIVAEAVSKAIAFVLDPIK